ncbi:MAG TPA: 3-isopropylmalate dehydrogenase [Anaerolineales bacterium]|nr:3-isopropylmalate dehydrogenase [Anaerolineales bacterium]
MKTYNIGVLGGDGIGPEVTNEGLKALRAVRKSGGFDCNFVEYPYSGAYYLKTKELVPDRVIEEWRTLDAVLLGAIGHPDVEVGLVERSVILGLRFGLDLYINLRPIKLYAEALCPLKGKGPDDIDFIVIRENTEGEYSQVGGILKKGTPDEVATSTSIYTRKGVERAIRYGFELARSRSAERNRPGHLTMVDKANAIRPQEIWTRTFAEVGKEYPDIKQDHAYVDAFTMLMIQQPERYDVIVTTNLFGDIITDLGSILQGGIGLAASANLHPGKTSMFEPIHGSAPDIAGQNLACPLGAIMAVSMMMDYLGEKTAAKRIEDGVAYLLSSGKIKSADAHSGIGTTQMGDMVVEQIQLSAG